MARVIVLAVALAYCSLENLRRQDVVGPDTVSVQCGNLTLTGLVWRPAGMGPFPALIFSHGNYASKSASGTIDDVLGSITSTSLLGPVFARHGYIFLGLFRRGTGLSKGQGESSQDLLLRSLKEKSLAERNELQVHLLETDQLQDMISGVRFLRGRRDVDTSRLGVIGHSFGGSLALVLAEHDPSLKAVVGFGAAAYSWNLSPQLRKRLTESVARMAATVLLIHAQNDYSTSPVDSLGAVMDRLKKPHSVKIYPKFGNNTDAGHNFIFLGIPIWERDVLRFLDENLRR